MDLKELLDFIIEREQNMDLEFKAKAEGLEVNDLINEVNSEFNPRNFTSGFEEGKYLNIGLHQGNYQVRVGPDEMKLNRGYRFMIRRFTGREVEDFYKRLSSEIVRVREEDSDDLPF